MRTGLPNDTFLSVMGRLLRATPLFRGYKVWLDWWLED